MRQVKFRSKNYDVAVNSLSVTDVISIQKYHVELNSLSVEFQYKNDHVAVNSLSVAGGISIQK